MVSMIDIILIIILAGFTFYGLFLGLIRTIGSLAGFLVALWVASHFYLNLYAWAHSVFLNHQIVGKIISFMIIFVSVRFLVVYGFSLINKTFNLLAIIPFMKLFNRLGGAILGFLEGSLIIGVVLIIGTNYYILENLTLKIIANSKIAPLILKIAKIIMPLIPELLNKAKGIVI